MNDTFIRACGGHSVDYTPIWIMRQAGRYLPEYKKVRSKVDFLTLCKTPELAAEVTIQPLDILGVDAAILFSDILIPIEPMGLDLKFLEKEGPVLSNPVRDSKSVENLRVINPDEDVPYVLETIRILSRELSTRVPLIGFSGAPFTLATYMIEGGSSKNFMNTKKMLFQHPGLFKELIEKISNMVISYLSAQIDAGVNAVQLFDSWAGVLAPVDYEAHIFPFVKNIIKKLRSKNIPVIYFVNNCAGLLHIAKESGADVTGVDWRIDMSAVAEEVGKTTSVQGNLDPCLLFSTKEHISEAAKSVLDKASALRGHIFNLGHGILPETPVDNAKALVDRVHELSSK